ncbi:IclR family transcriptional regulator [Leifsonia shinshuensis]|uniref:Glycerol operon regulatory protein n=1 Tax=Leifsonia shinshuensis TaxID=150026 RepID=A0A7G6YE14_9MICO|nr:IclR family transcriptional regulator [Leifsonia shinshuensis]QNE36729.1 IclR family transcriptional regulator [Leifsonia shinshuensis]
MIQSIDRAARILDLLRGARRLGISELAAALELPPSTVHGLVKSLQAHRLVAQEPGGNRYVLGPALLRLSSVYLDTLEVRSRSMRWMHELSQKTGLASRLGAELFGDVIVIHQERRPDGSEQMPETGVTIPSHASALGKVLLAFDDDHAAAVVQKGLRSLTSDTVTDIDALRQQFTDIRNGGLGTEQEEALIGECSIAAPIVAAGGEVVAALGLVVPSTEWPASSATASALREAARNISRELGGGQMAGLA